MRDDGVIRNRKLKHSHHGHVIRHRVVRAGNGPCYVGVDDGVDLRGGGRLGAAFIAGDHSLEKGETCR